MMSISWPRQLLIIASTFTISIAINRPVYKIILNSKGYAQFIQYDVDVPSLREFTLCVWVRVTSLESDQTIFTYIGNDDKRIIRLWLESGGRQIRISLDHDRVLSSAEVNFSRGVWRDVCFSYQADFGAWALYVDAKFVFCEASQNLQGLAFPGEGSLIFGYGTSEKGSPTGLTGEIYGASMILFSTIERNPNIIKKPWYKTSGSNKVTTKNRDENKYIVLGDLQTDEIQTEIPQNINNQLTNDYHHRTPDDKLNIFLGHPTLLSPFNNTKINDFWTEGSGDENKNKYLNHIYKDDILKVQREFKKELTGSSTRELPTVLEYETPPPILASTVNYFADRLENTGKKLNKKENNDNIDNVLSDVEKPPPLEHDSKVYGQWINSKFVGNVLNYLKSINFHAKKEQKKVPSTLPLIKHSDSYPYPSEITYTKIRPPPINKYRIHTERRHKIKRRDAKGRQINIQIVETGQNAQNMFKSLTKYPDPKLVEVTNRGEAIEAINQIESTESTNDLETSYKNHQLSAASNIFARHRGSNLMNILPFLRENDYSARKISIQKENTKTYQVYSKSLANDKKWHHVKSYNNDYSPRQIPNLESNAKAAVRLADKIHPTVKIKHKPDIHEQLQGSSDIGIINGRALANEVSNQAKNNNYNFPLLKFKYGLIPAKDQKITTSDNIAVKLIDNDDDEVKNSAKHFNKRVKLGNALNEQFIIGNDESQIKNTFLGGDDSIPDINRHLSKWETKSNHIPSSLGTRICKNIKLYVQENEGIGKSKIFSSILRNNIGIEFIEHSYKKCSMKDSPFKDSSLLLIDWIKTPVKLFGGAYPKKTKDLCGFF